MSRGNGSTVTGGEPLVITEEPVCHLDRAWIHNTSQNLDTTMMSDPNYWLRDMDYLYHRSFNELEVVF